MNFSKAIHIIMKIVKRLSVNFMHVRKNNFPIILYMYISGTECLRHYPLRSRWKKLRRIS